MKTVDISMTRLKPAPWNPNRMDETMMARLQESISRYGLVEPLVVRKINVDHYEVLSGNQRLKVLEDLGFDTVPCVLVTLDDARAMMLTQALNGLRGDDDPVLKGAMLKAILASVAEDEVLSLLPETAESLKSLSAIGEMDLAEHLKAWDKTQAARLRHMRLQFTNKQLKTVEEAVSLVMHEGKEGEFDNPNVRGNAIFMLCKFYLDRRKTK